MEVCRKCNHLFKGNFCPNCGDPIHLKRIDRKYIADEISSVFNFDKGIFLTIKELFLRPGKSIREFLTADRNRLVKPILFILITSLIYTLVNNYFKIEEQYIEFEATGTTANIFTWAQNNYGYTNILMSAFIALFLKLFFRKYRYNIYEILILLCFVMGMGMIIITVFALIQGITNLKLTETTGIVLIVYITFAVANFFNRKKIGSYIKALIAYILGIILFSFSVIAIGVLIDLILNDI